MSGSRSCVKIESRRCADLATLRLASRTSGMVLTMMRVPEPADRSAVDSSTIGPVGCSVLPAISACLMEVDGPMPQPHVHPLRYYRLRCVPSCQLRHVSRGPECKQMPTEDGAPIPAPVQDSRSASTAASGPFPPPVV